MNYVIILFGLLITLLSLHIIFQPKAAIGWIKERAASMWLYGTAIAARLIMGLVFLDYAEQSRFPGILEFLGYVFIAAAVIFALIGPGRFTRFVGWAVGRFANLSWLSGSLGVLFGVFLIYAVY